MNRELLSKAVGNIDDRFIAEARFSIPEDASGASERIVHMKKKRIISLALAAALILALGTAAYAIYNWRLQDLVMNEDRKEITTDEGGILPTPGPDGESGEPESQSYDPMPAGTDMLSLQGFTGSPEFQAAKDWAEFMHGYDRDGEILKAVGNDPTPWSEKYGSNNYLVYSQEMADTLDAIAAKYGLTLHSGFTSASIDDLRERFGDFCSEIQYGYGYCYADGTFSCDCENSKGMFQIRRCMKGVLDAVSLNVGNVEDYEQWEYTTACGKTVLLALSPRHALIIAESEQSFTVINVMAGSDPSPSGARISAAELEALADSIDFSIL